MFKNTLIKKKNFTHSLFKKKPAKISSGCKIGPAIPVAASILDVAIESNVPVVIKII